MLAICPGGGCDGLQQNDCVLVDQTQEPGSNNFNCRRVARGSRLFDKPIALVEQSVVAAVHA